MKHLQTIRHQALLMGLLALIIIFVPVIWMDIGPGGYQVYGPGVPDIYIFGGFITGKDLRFEPIDFAWKFQLCCILLFIILSAFVAIGTFSLRHKRLLIGIQLVLLCLFPFWIYLYTGGVVGNSDGADLSVYPHAGMILYLILLVWSIRVLVLSFREI